MSNRFSVAIAVTIGLALALVPVGTTRAAPKYDLLLKGGHVIDPGNSLSETRDIGVVDATIARVDSSIEAVEARKTIDVSGYYVVPGLIDIHAHVFSGFATSTVRSVIPDDHCFPSGVTTVVDAGTSGADNFEAFLATRNRRARPTQTRVLALVNISRTGMGRGENDPRTFDVARAVATATKYPDIVVGFKSAHYWTGRAYDAAHPPWASVERVLEAGERADLPVMVDFFPRPPSDGYPARSYRELIMERLRPGDIHTHCFAAHIPSIREDGTVNPDMLKAQRRGVIFDLGHGGGSFVYKHAVPAVTQGFVPNTISTDMHGGNVSNGKVVSMLQVMSKLLSMGLSLEDVIRRSTTNSAHAIRRPDLGTLKLGAPADVAVIRVARGRFGYIDTAGGKILSDRRLECVLTLFGGEVVFDPSGLSVPRWEEISKDSKYWAPPRQTW